MCYDRFPYNSVVSSSPWKALPFRSRLTIDMATNPEFISIDLTFHLYIFFAGFPLACKCRCRWLTNRPKRTFHETRYLPVAERGTTERPAQRSATWSAVAATLPCGRAGASSSFWKSRPGASKHTAEGGVVVVAVLTKRKTPRLALHLFTD